MASPDSQSYKRDNQPGSGMAPEYTAHRRCGAGMELTAPPCANCRVDGSSDTTPPCAFATGLVQAGGGPAHFDEYNNIALLLCGRKRFFIAPYAAMAWEDGEQNGEHNERRDVHPLLPGAHPQPSIREWLYADLGPGDVLFLPQSWWHFVDSEPQSVMTNLWVD